MFAAARDGEILRALVLLDSDPTLLNITDDNRKWWLLCAMAGGLGLALVRLVADPRDGPERDKR